MSRGNAFREFAKQQMITQFEYIERMYAPFKEEFEEREKKRNEFLNSLSPIERHEFILNEHFEKLENSVKGQLADLGNMVIVMVDKDRWEEFNNDY